MLPQIVSQWLFWYQSTVMQTSQKLKCIDMIYQVFAPVLCSFSFSTYAALFSGFCSFFSFLHLVPGCDAICQTYCKMCIVFIDPYEYHMDRCMLWVMFGQAASCPAVCLYVAKTLALYITCKLFCQICYTCQACRRHWLLSIYTAFTNHDFARGTQGQRKAKPIGYIFLHTFQLIRLKFDLVMKQLKLNILRLLLNKSYWNKGNNSCFTDYIKKTLMLACIQMFMNGFDSNLVWWQILLLLCILHLYACQIDLDLDWRS